VFLCDRPREKYFHSRRQKDLTEFCFRGPVVKLGPEHL
jgi:hypothetical protein